MTILGALMGLGIRPPVLPLVAPPLPRPARNNAGGTLSPEDLRAGGASLAVQELAAGLAVLTAVLSEASGPADLACGRSPYRPDSITRLSSLCQ